ncbi:MAG TPA: threonine synthase [Caulobacterales bacterium]|nr:threonine synthase [Caulobacterales bacterium]
MRYVSTRGNSPPVSFLDAVLSGLAPDGGLYVPEAWPSAADFSEPLFFDTTAADILAAFAGDDLSDDEVNAAVVAAYDWSAFSNPAITPLRQIGDESWLLELFHGPSLAFKDIAMRLLAELYEIALAKRGERRTIICATSGDTGGAAVEALKGRDRLDLVVLLPKGRVSEVQRRFMTTSGEGNVFAVEVDGDFDQCQAIVKALFADRDFAARASLSPVNSINWARIAAQSIYYVTASHILAAAGPTNFVVPTGNFGDAFAGYVAKQMGAPIGAILLATNANDILVGAVERGEYVRAAHSKATLSPAMDIQVASNFERLVFEALGRDGEATRRLYDQFAQSGAFALPPGALAQVRKTFRAASVDDARTRKMIATAYETCDQLVCPHTAVGLEAPARADLQLSRQIVYLSTAHAAKFPETVEEATGVRPPLPAKCADLFKRREQFDTLPADVEAVKTYIRERARAWR